MDILDEVGKYLPEEKQRGITVENVKIQDGVIIDTENLVFEGEFTQVEDKHQGRQYDPKLLEDANKQNDAINEEMLIIDEMSETLDYVQVEGEVEPVETVTTTTHTHNSYFGAPVDPLVGRTMEAFAAMSGSTPKYKKSFKKNKSKKKMAKASRKKNRKK